MTPTPSAAAPGRPSIERYGPAGFRIGGTIHSGAVLIVGDRVLPWAASSPEEVTLASLAPVIEAGGVEILLLGLGRRHVPVAAALRAALRQAGIGLETMDTGAACRTYSVLVAEDRRVAAALLPPA